MRKKILLFLFVFLMFGCKKEEPKIVTTLVNIEDNLVFEYASKNLLYDYISIQDGEFITVNQNIDTMELGEKNTIIEYYDNNKDKKTINLSYSVVDTTPPVLLSSSSYSIKKGANDNIAQKPLCGDNYDKNPNCYIEGEYDVNKVGNYDLKFIAVDTSGNKTEKKFTLKVKSKVETSSSSSSKKLYLDDAVKKYKNENTMIGIDVSTWQDEINWNKVKESGVEFAFIRIGFGHNRAGELVYDKQFRRNLEEAKKVGVKIGLYFYSYANTIEEAYEQAHWIIDSLNGEKLDLPIAFDWEDWSDFNDYDISITDLNIIAETFMNELKNSGYESMLYSSKYYLENIWNIDSFHIWLAHYTSETSYKGDYDVWQFSSRGRVDGINGDVDLNVLYK